MQKALHARDDIDRLYVSRKDRERGLANIEVSVDTSIRGLEDYIKKSKERLNTAIALIYRYNNSKTTLKRVEEH